MGGRLGFLKNSGTEVVTVSGGLLGDGFGWCCAGEVEVKVAMLGWFAMYCEWGSNWAIHWVKYWVECLEAALV